MRETQVNLLALTWFSRLGLSCPVDEELKFVPFCRIEDVSLNGRTRGFGVPLRERRKNVEVVHDAAVMRESVNAARDGSLDAGVAFAGKCNTIRPFPPKLRVKVHSFRAIIQKRRFQ